MENTKDQYIGAEIHSARSVNPDGETVTLDGDTVVWTGEEDVLTPEELEGKSVFLWTESKESGRKRTAERGCHSGIRVQLYIKGTTAPQGGLTKIS